MRGRAGLVTWAHEQAHVGPWRGDSGIAYLAPVADGPPPTPAFLHRCLETLATRGYSRVMTAALAPGDQRPYLAVGFEEHERLHLLAHDLQVLPEPRPHPGLKLRRARGAHWPAVLGLDATAFQPFWRLDKAGLQDALHATPARRFRVATVPPRSGHGGPGRPGGSPLARRRALLWAGRREVVGYIICGCAGQYGYVQRLAVRPGQQRAGLGSHQVIDGLRWMRRRGVEKAVVNTQLDNHAALALYERLGFRLVPSGLAVLRRDLA